MEAKLIDNYSELKLIREYIVKLGPSRRTTESKSFMRRFADATCILNNCKQILSCLSRPINQEILDLYNKIESLYSNILTFNPTMAESKFDLKTAVSLLPKMNGDEAVTQDLIDAIELYDSMLSDDSDRKPLINFVLKTRLNTGAKMRLSPSYTTVKSLINDIRTHLLTRKSDTALQAQLQTVKQHDKSVSDYGAEVEKLFVELTIAQANGNADEYNVLRRVNERNAIKRFADGLQSQKLSTIISAKNFTSLKDAIRAAEDESISTREYNPVMSYGTRGRFFRRNNFNNRSGRSNFRQNYGNNGSQQNSSSRGNGNLGSDRGASYYRAQQYRGTRIQRGRGRHQGSLNHFTQEENDQPDDSDDNFFFQDHNHGSMKNITQQQSDQPDDGVDNHFFRG